MLQSITTSALFFLRVNMGLGLGLVAGAMLASALPIYA